MSPKSSPPLVSAEPSNAEWRDVPRPFVKWVGGKAKVYSEIRAHLSPFEGRFHEPFVGGGAVFFSLARRPEGLPGGASLSDGNLRLVRTWTALRDQVDAVVERLAVYLQDYHRRGKDHYYEVRALPIDDMSDPDVAAWLIYLNKTGFNGLYRVNKKNGFNVPVGNYKRPRILDERNLRAVSEVLQGVEITHQDFEQACAAARPGDAVYLDPPYVPLSASAKFTAYTQGGFGSDDQRRLAEVARELKERGARVVLSNHDTPDVRALYKDHFKVRQIHVRRSVNRDATKRGKVAEVLIW